MTVLFLSKLIIVRFFNKMSPIVFLITMQDPFNFNISFLRWK